MRHRFALGWAGSLLLSGCMLCSLFAVTSLLTFGPGTSTAVAQDDDQAAAGAKADEGGGSAETKESLLHYLWKTLGLRYTLAFLIITFNLVALMVMNILGCRRDQILPQALVDSFEAQLNEKRYQEAYELAKNDESFLGHVLAAGMAKLSNGYDDAMQAMQEVGEEENMKIEHRVNYIALCAQLGPMFGLLGTVDGMVGAFDVIAHSNVTPKPSELAQGIGTALVTTVVGLCIAIPAIAFHHIIKNRFQRLVLEAGVVSEGLMKRFQGVQAAVKK